jgi:hypothetical protein
MLAEGGPCSGAGVINTAVVSEPLENCVRNAVLFIPPMVGLPTALHFSPSGRVAACASPNAALCARG